MSGLHSETWRAGSTPPRPTARCAEEAHTPRGPGSRKSLRPRGGPGSALGRIHNGLYTLRVSATDINGQTSFDERPIGVDGFAKVGVVRRTFVDLEVPVSGIPIVVERTYDSRVRTSRDFGFGWTLLLRAGSLEHNRSVGEGWSLSKRPGFGEPLCGQVNELKHHVTEVRLSDKEAYRFRPRVKESSGGFGFCEVVLGFEFVDGTYSGATLEIVGQSVGFQQSGDTMLRNPDTLAVYQVESVRLTTRDGRVFDLGLRRGITRIADANGNSLTISPHGIVHSSGRAVQILRDASGRVSRITDPMGRAITYSYDASGDLAMVTDLLGQTTAFEYSEVHRHYLERILRDDGTVESSVGFDSGGRVASICDGNGQCTTTQHDLLARSEVVIDPTGRVYRLTYDERGLVRTLSDAFGTTGLDYDVNDELVRITDQVGAVTELKYDGDQNLIARVEPHLPSQDPADFTTGYTYDTAGRITGIHTSAGGSFAFEYDANGNELSITDEFGGVVRAQTFDGSGNATSETDRFGTVLRTFDLSGNVTSEFDVERAERRTYTHNATGDILSATDEVTGRVITLDYDALGRELRMDLGPGVGVTTAYDAFSAEWTHTEGTMIPGIDREQDGNGSFTGWRRADGSRFTVDRDDAGRALTWTDPLGRTASATYDAAGRVETITNANGATTRTVRDAAGRGIERVDALGNSTAMTYRPDGKVETFTDENGHLWSFEYTPTSAKVKDPLGREFVTHYGRHGLAESFEVFDAPTTLMASSAESAVSTESAALAPSGPAPVATSGFTYLFPTSLDDGEDYPNSFTDALGRARNYRYDAIGAIAGATDLGGVEYLYEHDLDGALTAVVFPNGDRMEVDYDAMGQVARTRPGTGGEWTRTYDTAGELATLSKPSLATVTFSHDSLGDLRQVSTTDGELVAFDRFAAGLQTSETLGTTVSTYDDEGALVRLQHPDGSYTRFEYDARGQTATIAVALPSTSERTTTYEFDKAGNMVGVVDPLGGRTQLSYDAANRLIDRLLPNGVRTTWDYDALDRVIAIVHRDSSGSVLASRSYTLSPAGEPTEIVDEDGTLTRLEYDASARLSAETRLNGSGVEVGHVSYSYDPAGNRLSRSSDPFGESYAYLPGHVLKEVVTSSGTESITHDLDGRVSSISGPRRSLSLVHDDLERLRQVTNSATSEVVDYDVDFEGRRLAARSAASARHYTVGPLPGSGLPVVYAARDGVGGLLAHFVYAGNTPLIEITPSGPKYILEDRLGSVIGYADAAGTRVASFDYDTFGEVIGQSGPAVSSALRGGPRFHGLWLDEATGLYHVNLREYDPLTGRFLSRDPAEAIEEVPESFHPYNFAFNNPSALRDPTGTTVDASLLGMFTGLQARGGVERAQALALNYVRGQAKEMIQEAATNMINDFLMNIVVGSLGNLPIPSSATHAFQRGRDLEASISGIVCKAVDGTPLEKISWFEPNMAPTGQPVGNGRQVNAAGGCSAPQANKADWGKIKGNARPDFLMSAVEPKLLRLHQPGRSLLVGEVKFSTRHALRTWRGRQRRQFNAITNHARDYQWVSVAWLTSLISTPGEILDLKMMFAIRAVRASILTPNSLHRGSRLRKR